MYYDKEAPHGLERLYAKMRAAKINRTDNRDLIFRWINAYAPVPMSRLRELATGTVAKTTLYRAIHAFEGAELIHQVRPGVHELTEKLRWHGHGLNCRACGRRIGYRDERLEREVARIASELKFRLEDHVVEMTGVCKVCADK